MIWLLAACTPDDAAPQATATTPSPPPATAPTSADCEWRSDHTPDDGCTTWEVNADLQVIRPVVPAGTTVEAGPGVVITAVPELRAIGREDAPIVFQSQGTGSWGGLVLRADPTDPPTSGSSGSGYYPDAGYEDDESRLSNVEIRDAGAGTAAAIVLEGGYLAQALRGSSAPELEVDGLSVLGSESGGVFGGRILAESPIAFADVAGELATVDARYLEADLVEDRGGNAVPAIVVQGIDLLATVEWRAQAVPIHVLGPVQVNWTWNDEQARMILEPNTLRFAEGAGLTLAGAGLVATGVTFEGLDSAVPWDGIAVLRETTEYVALQGVSLDGVTIGGTTSPALDWDADARQTLELTDTIIRDVAGDDVCIEGCVPVDASNTLDCATPVACG